MFSVHLHYAVLIPFQMLEFCETMNPNLDGYEADGVRFTTSLRASCFLTAFAGMAHSS